MFPFPCTGKAFPNEVPRKLREKYAQFPFPSTGKAFPNKNKKFRSGQNTIISFHSLPPGRHFRTSRNRLKNGSLQRKRFHSLQPGRHFRTRPVGTHGVWHVLVSIPFHREGISEHWNKHFLADDLFEFRFPFTGKAFPNLGSTTFVKLPHFKFRFPSTGKAFPNFILKPFIIRMIGLGFHSLAPGRHFRTKYRGSCGKSMRSFHSLQPGRHFRTKQLVSIGSKPSAIGFHSLQPGRHFRTLQDTSDPAAIAEAFPFPSTGKAFPNVTTDSRFI